jgi:hypothetical protein
MEKVTCDALETLERLKKVAEDYLPNEWLHKPGSVLASHISTVQKGRIYLVGINPGRKAGQSPTLEETIEESLEGLKKGEPHSYVYGKWHPHQLDGGDALQLRARWLCEQLSVDIETICTSNGVFLRGHEQPKSAKYKEDFEKCWPVHKFLLEQVKPDVIIAYGERAWKAFFSKLEDGREQPVCECDYKFKGWLKRGCFPELGRNVAVFGIPHLSRYTPDACTIKELRLELSGERA